VAQFGHLLRSELPLREPLPPLACNDLRVLLSRGSGARKPCVVEPGLELVRRQIRKRQQQVGKVTFDVDDDHANRRTQRFFDRDHQQTSLAAASHPDNHSMREQVFGRQLERLSCARTVEPTSAALELLAE
jgi:hypothetical protein